MLALACHECESVLFYGELFQCNYKNDIYIYTDDM